MLSFDYNKRKKTFRHGKFILMGFTTTYQQRFMTQLKFSKKTEEKLSKNLTTRRHWEKPQERQFRERERERPFSDDSNDKNIEVVAINRCTDPINRIIGIIVNS